MRKTGWMMAALIFWSAAACAAEVGLVTASSGGVRLQEDKSVATDLKPFTKLREGDRLTLSASSRLQVVFFDGGRQETWQGAGILEVGNAASKAVKGDLQAEVKTLPAILVKQLSKTPSPDGAVKTGMIRMRSMPSGGTLESVEKNYADLRQKSEVADRTPELYLLASYFELREFEKLDGLLKQLGEKSPKDPEVKLLVALYSRAVSNAQQAESK